MNRGCIGTTLQFQLLQNILLLISNYTANVSKQITVALTGKAATSSFLAQAKRERRPLAVTCRFDRTWIRKALICVFSRELKSETRLNQFFESRRIKTTCIQSLIINLQYGRFEGENGVVLSLQLCRQNSSIISPCFFLQSYFC